MTGWAPADVQCFEMEELMHSKAAVMAVLRYLFARFDERFDGAPTLLILDEAWLFLDDPVFAARIRQWLKTLRKKNVSVIFATQSLADIKDSSIAPAIIESCASRIFLPTRRRPSRRFARSTRASASTGGRSRSSPPRSPSATTTTNPASAIACSTSTWGRRRWPSRALPRRKTSATWTACCRTPASRLRGRLAAPSRPRLGRRPAALVPRRAGFPPDQPQENLP
jgi:hypothetical protein